MARPYHMQLLAIVVIITSSTSLSYSLEDVHQRLMQRVPIFSEEDAKYSYMVTDVTECIRKCNNSQKFIFTGLGQHQSKCVCLYNSSLFGYGLISQQNSDTYFIPNKLKVMRNFLYMDIDPIRESSKISLTVNGVPRRLSLDECALICLNYAVKSVECFAFEYNVIAKECNLYDKSHFSKLEGITTSKVPGNKRRLYFEKLSNDTNLFAATWNAKASGLIAIDELRGLKDLTASACAKKCYSQLKCFSFNYDATTGGCNGFADGITSNKYSKLGNDIKSIYFEMIPSDECDTYPYAITSDSGYILSPGWPYSLSEYWTKGKKECRWKILTAWGRHLKLKDEYFSLDEGCKQSLYVNGQKLCGKDMDYTAKAKGVESNITLSVENWPSAKEEARFLLHYSRTWLCEFQDQILKTAGEIASGSYPHSSLHPVKCNWQLQPPKDQHVTIQFEDMNLQYEKQPSLKNTTLKFKSKNKQVMCTGNSFNAECRQKMTFEGPVNVSYEGILTIGTYRGFKAEYYFGDEKNTLKEVNSTFNFNLTTMRSELVDKKGLEKNSQTTLTYNIKNLRPRGFVKVRIISLKLSEKEGLNDCSVDYITVTDKDIKGVNFTFCGRRPPEEIITSQGSEVSVKVFVKKMPFNGDSRPEREVVFEASTGFRPPIPEPEIIVEDADLTSDNYPKNYPKNSVSSFVIKSNDGLEPILEFDDFSLAEFQYNGTAVCDNDRLVLQSGPEKLALCGKNKIIGEKIFARKDGDLRIDFTSDDMYFDRGFKANVRFVKVSRCVAGKDIEVSQDEYLLSDGFPDPQMKDVPCRWRLRTSNATGIRVNFEGQCQTIKYIIPENETYASTFDCKKNKFVHLPSDSLLIWDPKENGRKFLASLGEMDLTTTPIPTTTVTTTTTTTTTTMTTTTTTTPKPTTEAPTTLVTTEPMPTSTQIPDVLDPGANQDKRKGGNSVYIGVGVGVFLLIAIITVVVVVVLRRRQRLLDMEYERFPKDVVSYDNQIYRNPQDVQHDRRYNIESIAYDEC